MNNRNNKDIANSLNKYTEYSQKGIEQLLNGAEKINNKYAESLINTSNKESINSRIETSIDNNDETEKLEQDNKQKIETKKDEYNNIQTDGKVTKENKITNKINTSTEKNENSEIKKGSYNKQNNLKGKSKIQTRVQVSKGVATGIKGIKTTNKIAQGAIKTGKSINTGLSEDGLQSFEGTSSRIMTRPIKNTVNKTTKKATRATITGTKRLGKKIGKRIQKKVNKDTLKSGANAVVKATKLVTKLIAETMKILMSMLPQMAPVIIIIVIIAALSSFLNIDDSDETDNMNFDTISSYMIEIEDTNLQLIYNEFLKNIGKPYLMDHSNLSYDTCMDYYDCSSWVIHCLAHTGIKTIPDTTASGIYNNYCEGIDVNDRQAGDLIFLKDTYDTGDEGSISHVGIYMGTLTINNETAEWVIDTGSAETGVRITKYTNGWWNSEEYFYGFGRLK